MDRTVVVRELATTKPGSYIEVSVNYYIGTSSMCSFGISKRGYYVGIKPIQRHFHKGYQSTTSGLCSLYKILLKETGSFRQAQMNLMCKDYLSAEGLAPCILKVLSRESLALECETLEPSTLTQVQQLLTSPQHPALGIIGVIE